MTSIRCRLLLVLALARSAIASFSTSNMESRADKGPGAGQKKAGQGIVSFLTAIGVALAIFIAQFCLFLLLRNKLARIFKPKTYLVPERERTEPPPRKVVAMLKGLVHMSDREIIKKCGLDAYFFLRYLKTLAAIFIPICAVVLPILIPINYIDGRGHDVNVNNDNQMNGKDSQSVPTGLDTLAWSNVRPKHYSRYAAHLLMAILVVIWVCGVFFFEMRAYIKVRQDYLTSAEHRLRASATTVLVSSIPQKWLTEEALHGLFDVFPGGVRNVWLNRDLTKLLDKISLRNDVHSRLESAETELIKSAKKAQLKKHNNEEKKRRKELHLKALTKKEKDNLESEINAKAKKMADGNEGLSSGTPGDIPHTVAAGVRESAAEVLEHDADAKWRHSNRQALRASGCEKVDTEAQSGLRLDNAPAEKISEGRGDRPQSNSASLTFSDQLDLHPTLSKPQTPVSTSSTSAIRSSEHNGAKYNTVRRLEHEDDIYAKEETKFWQFWKPPSGGYASPVPQGPPAEEQTKTPNEPKSGGWQKFKSVLPFIGGDDENLVKYPVAFNPDYEKDLEEKAVWEQYLQRKHRPTHHLPLFGVTWLFGLPGVTKKVDTIYWCREELARLNVEIEEDQKHPDRFPLLKSAFIQFNHQVAAHMACQSAIHHIPKEMTPRISEISPKDIVWDNMAVTWWQEWLRTLAVSVIVAGMVLLWAIPVAWSAALGQLDKLISNVSWLDYLKEHKDLGKLVSALSGVLPAALLGLLLVVLPLILDLLGGLKGAKTGSQKNEFVQICYFIFLFIQVFLVVSIASFFTSSLDTLVGNLKRLQDIKFLTQELLAKNLPAAANYFFSYMVLQALSTSSGTLLQIATLLMWFIIGPMFDTTARNKWQRNTKLNQIRWGSFFPVYTNFACIALVYCVIAPLIAIFAVITFTLLWMAHRYAMVYVTRFENDTGGVLYPRAINQTFTGLYFMELCLVGLFFIVRDEQENLACATHGTIMVVVLVLTIIYQFLLNITFSPLMRHLPITFEDEAVLRDEAFQRAQDSRFGITHESEEEDDRDKDDEESEAEKTTIPVDGGEDIELRKMRKKKQDVATTLNPVAHISTWAKGGGKQVGAWARDGGNQLRKLKQMADSPEAVAYRRQQRQKDLEAQRAMGEALYGDIHDEIEDLTPEERDMLTKHAFQHYALRARRPTVWIPRDDIGISDDEVRRTKAYSDHVWISNEGTALDSKLRVIYGKNPPDFSEVDVINL